jgi:hypothetical protein
MRGGAGGGRGGRGGASNARGYVPGQADLLLETTRELGAS